MSWKLINLLFCCIFSSILVRANTQSSVHRRFEYKYSFKPPYLAQKDGSVPFWEYGGNAIASGESVRLAPSLRSQKGAIWSKQPINFEWWEVDIMFKVTGRGRVGADGLAFWYTAERGGFAGEVFGAADRWRGLALLFDSFDNDNKHNNPYIMAVLNDGTQVFDHKSDGAAQLTAGCLRDFRNKPFPTRARLEYYLNTLTVHFHNGMTNNEADYELCFRAENVVLPRGGYFGVSAATGGLADDHDVIHLLTTSLHAPPADGAPPASAPGAASSEEQRRLAQEYQEYQRRLDQQKEDYRKEHPDEAERAGEPDEWFESDGQRELRQIFQGQAHMHDALRDLHRKLDEVLGKQSTSLSMLTAVYGQAQAPAAAHHPQQVGGAGAGAGAGSGGAGGPARHEWDALLANNQLIVNTIAELKGFIVEVSRKSDAVLAAGAGAGGAPASAQLTAELRDSLQQLKQAANRAGAGTGAACPEAGCVGAGTVLAVAAAHLALLLLYALYRDRKEAQAKKFF